MVPDKIKANCRWLDEVKDAVLFVGRNRQSLDVPASIERRPSRLIAPREHP